MDTCGLKRAYGEGARQQRHLSVCSVCGVPAHSLSVSWNPKIFELEQFQGMSCFQIFHNDYVLGCGGQREGKFRRQPDVKTG